MAIDGPARANAPSLTSLPSYEDIPKAGDGLDAEHVREAFDAFRRHAAQLQAQLRVLQAAGPRSGEASGHAVRMDALHMIRAAAEFADVIESDAQTASAAQIARTEQEISKRQRELQSLEAEADAFRKETERQRAEILKAAQNEARDERSRAHADATRELQEAEARGALLLEQARHQATELTNGARAEVEQTLEWARTRAAAVLSRAQAAAEQLLTAAGLGPDAVGAVASKIVESAEAASGAAPAPRDVAPPPESADPTS